MPLRVAVVGLSHRWQALLDQIGVFYQSVEPEHITRPEETGPVLLLGDGVEANRKVRQAVQSFLKAGGAVLLQAPLAAALFGLALRSISARALLTPPSDPFFPLPFTPVESTLAVLDHADCVLDDQERATVTRIDYGGGRLLVLPGGLIDQLGEYQVVRRKFFVPNRSRFPTERVCRVNRQGIRYLVEKGFQLLFHELGLPYVVRWPFPRGADGVFLFRVDTDFARPDQIEALYQLFCQWDVPATWFVETASAEDHLGLFARMEGQEIGLHCYRHRIFPTVEENLADIRRGLAVLAKVGLQPTSYAGPYGEWNPALHRALVHSGFTCSSEFALAYDDRPFALPACQDARAFWQLPIHPISVRRLFLAGFSESEMVSYYLQKLNQLAAYRQPVVFYHHPGHGRLAVFREVFQQVQRLGWPKLSFREYLDWWAASRKAEAIVTYQGGHLLTKGASPDQNLVLGVHWPRSKEADPEIWQLISLATPETRQWQPPAADNPPTEVGTVRRLLRKDWRMWLNDWESYRGKRKR